MKRQIVVRLHNTFSKQIPFAAKLPDDTELRKDCDYISPADRVSNIRRIRYCIMKISDEIKDLIIYFNLFRSLIISFIDIIYQYMLILSISCISLHQVW